MKATIFISTILVSFHVCSSFMTFADLGKLRRCYDGRGNKRMLDEIVNGQKQPLPSSMETFVSLVERLEAAYPNIQPSEMIRRLFVSFRVDEVPSDLRFEDAVWGRDNLIERAFFGIESTTYAWKDEDITEDEQCALHFMLSHSINDTLQGEDNEEAVDGESKHPREFGLVSLYGKPKHAFSLGKVLLGIYAGLLGNNIVDATELNRKMKSNIQDDRLNGIKVNRLLSVTLADLVIVYIKHKPFNRGEISFMPNGGWDDVTCPTEYSLEDNNKKIITNSLIRGAIDGMIIGRRIEDNPTYYRKLRLSEILRMYYGPTGLIDEKATSSKADIRSDFQWCRRMDNFRAIPNFNEEVLNYLKFYANLEKDYQTEEFSNDINAVLSYIQGSSQIFNDVTDEAIECSKLDSTLDKCKTPVDIFPILDWQSNENQKSLQIELLGILSTDFEIRPHGNSIGAYTNLSPMQNKGLHTIANNTGISGCPACFAKYLQRVSSSKQGEVEVLTNLNETLTEFVEMQDSSVSGNGAIKIGVPSKVVLLFNFGNPVNDQRLRDAIWEIIKNFREVTVLAIGTRKDSLEVFTTNYDTDVFTDVNNAAALAIKLKTRICKAPAEFTFKECYRSNRGSESDNKLSGFIPAGKKQYWAMYPKYFLKSYGLRMKFRALDGAQIKVCFSRSYYRIQEESTEHKDCREPSEEVEFSTSNPCYKYNEHNCYPFYFSVEGMKPSSAVCESIHCRTPKDIHFEFSHEGISCNTSSYIYSSSFLVMFAVLFTLIKKF